MKRLALLLSLATLVLSFDNSASARGRSRLRFAKKNRPVAVGIYSPLRFTVRPPTVRLPKPPVVGTAIVESTPVETVETVTRVAVPAAATITTAKPPVLKRPVVRFRRIRRP